MTIYIEQPDIKIKHGPHAIFSLLQSDAKGNVSLTARPNRIETAEKWLKERLSSLNAMERTPNEKDDSVTYTFNCSASTVAHELVACGLAPSKILNQIKITVLQDSFNCPFTALVAKGRNPLPLRKICIYRIVENFIQQQLNTVSEESKEALNEKFTQQLSAFPEESKEELEEELNYTKALLKLG